MTRQSSPSKRKTIQDYINKKSSFDVEQEVSTRSWYLPSHTVSQLRAYIIGEFGTTQHIGSFCTRAIRNWMQDTPSDDTHQTWVHLKYDYNYDADVSNWTYRQYQDYSEMDKENKTALGFSAPATVIDEFTENLNRNEYGSELANAVEAELLKLAQIERMQTHIESDDAERTDDEAVTSATPSKVEVDGDGNIADLSAITVDEDITLSIGDVSEFIQNKEIGYENRRGLLASLARSQDKITKTVIYDYDETSFGIDTNRSKRKDINAIIEQAGEDTESLCIAPAKVVMEEMNVSNNLASTAGLTNRRQPLNFDDDETFREFRRILYNSDNVTNTEMWEQFGSVVCDIGYQLSEVVWNTKDTVTAVYKGIHYRNALQKYIPVINTVQDCLEQDDDELIALKKRVDMVIELLEEALAKVMNFRLGTGNKGIEAAYERFKKAGETPTSLEFDTAGRMKKGQVIEP